MRPAESELCALLALVQQAVRAADFPALAQLCPAVEDMTVQFATGKLGTPTASGLAHIQAEAARSNACLRAAARGLRAARQRLSDVEAAGTSLVTYDGTGRKSGVPVSGDLVRRF